MDTSTYKMYTGRGICIAQLRNILHHNNKMNGLSNHFFSYVWGVFVFKIKSSSVMKLNCLWF